jgi:hypothetical protein
MFTTNEEKNQKVAWCCLKSWNWELNSYWRTWIISVYYLVWVGFFVLRVKLKSVSWTQVVEFKANWQNIHEVWTRKCNQTFPAKEKVQMKTLELPASLKIPEKFLSQKWLALP